MIHNILFKENLWIWLLQLLLWFIICWYVLGDFLIFIRWLILFWLKKTCGYGYCNYYYDSLFVGKYIFLWESIWYVLGDFLVFIRWLILFCLKKTCEYGYCNCYYDSLFVGKYIFYERVLVCVGWFSDFH